MFLHSLALRMGRTVGELTSTLTTDELARWLAFNRRSPITDERLDYLFARLCLVVTESSGAKKRGGGRFSIDDFLMFKQPRQKTPKELMRQLFGQSVVKKSRKH